MVQPEWLKFIKMNKNVLSAAWLSEMFNCNVSLTDIKKVFSHSGDIKNFETQ